MSATDTQPKSPNGHHEPAQQPPPPAPPPHALTPALAPFPPPAFNGHYAPHPGAYPSPFYTYAPMPDGSHDPNAPNGMPAGPFLVAYPHHPGMVYITPPGHRE